MMTVLPTEVAGIIPLPRVIRGFAILDRCLLAQNLGRDVNQRPLFERVHRQLELTEQCVYLLVVSSASSSIETPALMRRTLDWRSTSLFKGMP